jgi:TolB-like protein
MATFSFKDFLKEARRRRVFRVTAIYIVGAWVALQAADLAFPGLGIDESAILYVWIGAILGLPIALFFGWRYDITGGRIVRTPASDVDTDLSIGRTDYVILAALSIVVVTTIFGLISQISDTRIPKTTPFVITDIDPNSIAVLPFLNMSDDPEQEYFSDGISEDILNLLAQIPEMRVTSRSSAFSFKGQNLDVPTMAARLNVAHVLEGSVRKSGNQLRIVAQLIEVETDTHLWSETYDRELKNVFAIQDEIAAAVVDVLKITLLGQEVKAAETDPEAYALYLQGIHFVKKADTENVKQAETLLGNELARDAIQKALSIDPQYGPAYTALASVEMDYDWDFTAADQHLQQARALNPGDFVTLMKTAELNGTLGRIDEAVDLYRQAVNLDPVSWFGYAYLGASYYAAHRLDEAAETLRLAVSLNPGGYAAHYVLGLVLLAQGDAPAALVAMEQETGDIFRLVGMAIVQHALGDARAADAAINELIEKYGAGEIHGALVYAFRGEIDLAFATLERAYDARDPGLSSLLVMPLFANLYQDPRWEPFLEKMGLPHE